MKNTRSLVMAVVALLFGSLAVFVAMRWMTDQTAAATEKVVTAAKDVDIGTQLTGNMVRIANWPTGSAPKGVVTDPAKVEGRVLTVSLMEGEPVLESKLAPIGAEAGLPALIKDGNRAITVRVNEVIGVAGFTMPGNFVDILVNLQQDQKNETVSKIVLENIRVLAVAQDVGRAKGDTKAKIVNAVTLEVTPEQAEKLDLARSVGTLSLVLRSQTDKKPLTTTGARRENLFLASPSIPASSPSSVTPPPANVAEAPVVKPKSQPPVHKAHAAASHEEGSKVEIIRGMEKVTQTF